MTQIIDHTPTPAWQTPPPPPPAADRPWYRKKRMWIGAIVGLMIIGAAAGGSKPASSTGHPLPAGSDQTAVTTAPVATTVPTSAPAKATPTTAKPTPTTAAQVVAPTVSSCDRVREALLTGTQAQINGAMAALQADKLADATAREYADYYLHRDAVENGLRSMDVSLIRMACS